MAYKKVSDAQVEFNDRGSMRIRVGNTTGNYTDYHDVATLTLEVNGKIKTYIAVTEYGLSDGALQPETVYEIVKA